jgi:D-sedoheptulose 7-phosphate isomerase
VRNSTKIKDIKNSFLSLLEQAINENEENIIKAVEVIEKALKKGRKILCFGNGGSAADAMHFSAEIVGRFKSSRRGYPAIALSSNPSILTAIGNDFGFQWTFARQIEAYGEKGDVAIGFTTSGKSINVIEGLRKAEKLKLRTIAFCGEYTELLNFCEILISVPSSETSRIQEVHEFIYHTIIELLEEKL